MQAIILAAGIGKRLLPLTKDKPKSMVKLLGKPIIEYTMDALVRRKVSEIIIVVGYCKDIIIDYFGDTYKGIKIRYVLNKYYEITNNIYSLKLGLSYVTEDLILCEGDIVFKSKILDIINEDPIKNLVYVGKYKSYMCGTVVKINWKTSETIDELIPSSKQTEDYDYTDVYKTVNVYYFSFDFLKEHFIPTLDLYLSKYPMTGYYEIVIGVVLCLGNNQLYAYTINNNEWFEIDDEADLEMAEYLFSKDKFKLVENLFGGYWRYGLLDFCYLCNLYFPDKTFYSKLYKTLPALIKHYPSAHSKLCIMLSRWYKEDSFTPENIIIGNGASELIRIVNKTVVKKITIPIPTFNEYENKLDESQINYFSLSETDDFKLAKEDFVDSVRKSKSNVALIINPNNPTGSIIDKNDLIWIIEQLKDIIVIVDESFIDFSGNRDKFSVQNLINEYHSLMIIRSISKEFGVPGFRLGYLVTLNKAVKEKILEQLPIWNINSIAEYFIENFPKYYDEYMDSIRSVIEDRNELFENLKTISFLKPVHSYANFILCKLENYSAQDLTRELFNDFKILIKDCSNKKLLDKDNYVRIAVRTKEDNDKLLNALKKLEGQKTEKTVYG